MWQLTKAIDKMTFYTEQGMKLDGCKKLILSGSGCGFKSHSGQLSIATRAVLRTNRFWKTGEQPK